MMSTTLVLRRTRKTLTGLLTGLALLGASVSAMAQSVVVQGNKRVDTDTIRSYVSDQAPEAAKRDLLQTGLFSSVDVRRSGSQTIVTVRENDVINRIVFEGNKKLKSDVFEGELQLKPRGAFSLILPDGSYAPHVPHFAGKRILTPEGKDGDANGAVIKALIDHGKLLAKGSLRHSYPHSWRSKAKIIFRCTPQFVGAGDSGELHRRTKGIGLSLPVAHAVIVGVDGAGGFAADIRGYGLHAGSLSTTFNPILYPLFEFEWPTSRSPCLPPAPPGSIWQFATACRRRLPWVADDLSRHPRH